MNKLLKSKIVAWMALLLVIVVIIISFNPMAPWWSYSDEFFAFMMVFCQLVSVYIVSFSARAAHKLQMCAAVFGVLLIIALIAEYFALQ